MSHFSPLEQRLADELELPLKSFAWSSVSGGDTHSSYKLIIDSEQGRQTYFVKRNGVQRESILRSEYDSLVFFLDYPALAYPKPVVCFSHEGETFLVMEYREQQPMQSSSMPELGKLLACHHQIIGESFGWQRDNYIGSSLQKNPWSASWPEFFAEHRLGFQLEMAVENNLSSSMVQRIQIICDAMESLFFGYTPEPSLLHGDLWSGNVGQSVIDGAPLMFDPAPYFGGRESDIAMTELFGGFSGEFYDAYQAQLPLDSGYEKRRPAYQLYHSLNHFNLFGSGYTGLLESHVAALERALI